MTLIQKTLNWIFDELIKLGMWAMAVLFIHSLIVQICGRKEITYGNDRLRRDCVERR